MRKTYTHLIAAVVVVVVVVVVVIVVVGVVAVVVVVLGATQKDTLQRIFFLTFTLQSFVSQGKRH